MEEQSKQNRYAGSRATSSEREDSFRETADALAAPELGIAADRVAQQLRLHIAPDDRGLAMLRWEPVYTDKKMVGLVLTEKFFVVVHIGCQRQGHSPLTVESFSSTKLRAVETVSRTENGGRLTLKFASGVIDWASGRTDSDLFYDFDTWQDPALTAFSQALAEVRR